MLSIYDTAIISSLTLANDKDVTICRVTPCHFCVSCWIIILCIDTIFILKWSRWFMYVLLISYSMCKMEILWSTNRKLAIITSVRQCFSAVSNRAVACRYWKAPRPTLCRCLCLNPMFRALLLVERVTSTNCETFANLSWCKSGRAENAMDAS